MKTLIWKQNLELNIHWYRLTTYTGILHKYYLYKIISVEENFCDWFRPLNGLSVTGLIWLFTKTVRITKEFSQLEDMRKFLQHTFCPKFKMIRASDSCVGIVHTVMCIFSLVLFWATANDFSVEVDLQIREKKNTFSVDIFSNNVYY